MIAESFDTPSEFEQSCAVAHAILEKEPPWVEWGVINLYSRSADTLTQVEAERLDRFIRRGFLGSPDSWRRSGGVEMCPDEALRLWPHPPSARELTRHVVDHLEYRFAFDMAINVSPIREFNAPDPHERARVYEGPDIDALNLCGWDDGDEGAFGDAASFTAW